MPTGPGRHRVVVIGAGPGGLCMAKRLLDDGIDDFVVLEKAPGVGGTWFHNSYPGCECDIPSALYSFSFAPKPDWSKPYGTQPEILAYLNEVADRFGIRHHVRCDTEVTTAGWSDDEATWTITTSGGERYVADVLVSAMGMFNRIAVPDIDGLDRFAGDIFHSARWRHDLSLTGRRVAVIGSAASAVQFVPEIAPTVERLHLFQRTANWVLPKQDSPYPPEVLDRFRAHPELVRQLRDQIFTGTDMGLTFSDPVRVAELEAAGRAALEAVADPDVRARLVPQHPFGCKRPLFSNVFYPTFNLPQVELVTDPISSVDADGVWTADGRRRPVDVIVLATGFATAEFASAIEVRGRGGVDLRQAWRDGAMAYLGITTSGFPNLFMLYGPNTNNGSLIAMAEYEVEHVMAHLHRMDDEHLTWVDVRPEAMADWNAHVDAAMATVTAWQAGCNTYYRAPNGRIVTQWPGSMSEFARRTATVDPAAFEVGR